MKKKTLFLSLTKAFFLLLVVCCFSFCAEGNVKVKDTGYIVDGKFSLKIVEIDSCEYFYGDWGSATVLTHKGNCSFCSERLKK